MTAATDDQVNIEELKAKAADCELLGSLASEPAVREENRKRAAEYRQQIADAEARIRTQAA